MRQHNVIQNTCVWSHQSHAIFYRVDQQWKRIFCRTMQKFALLCFGLVSSERWRIRFNGRTLYAKVSPNSLIKKQIVWRMSIRNNVRHFFNSFFCKLLQSSRCLLRHNQSWSAICSWLSRKSGSIRRKKIYWTEKVTNPRSTTIKTNYLPQCTTTKTLLYA